jgi:dynein heavy chain
LIGSAFLSYTGAFNHEFRTKMVYENWFEAVTLRELPCNIDYRLETLLTSDVEISRWASEGLPGDELSI